jgi:hypothetical protein
MRPLFSFFYVSEFELGWGRTQRDELDSERRQPNCGVSPSGVIRNITMSVSSDQMLALMKH